MNNKIVRNVIAGIALVMFVGIGIYIGMSQITKSKAPKSDEKSVTDVLAYMKEIGTDVHNAGSPDNEKVREYITAKLEQMSVPYAVEPFEFDVNAYAKEKMDEYEKKIEKYPELQEKNKKFLEEEGYKDLVDYAKDTLGLRNKDHISLNNIVASFDAPNTDKAILFVTHYDSRPDTANATSSCLGVAAFIQAISEQAKKEAPKMDLHFLFTDGKEIDTLGAKEYLKKHKELVNNIQVVLNFDSQGTDGSLMLYETSKKDNRLLKQYKDAVKKNTTFSFLTNLCKLTPYDSDFKVFNEANLQAMNFTMLQGANTYSRRQDTLDKITEDSIYEYVKTVNEFVSYYAKQTEVAKDTDSTVFFNFLNGNIVTLPGKLISVVTYITSMLAMGLFFLDKVRTQIDLRKIAKGTLFTIASMIITALAVGGFVGPQVSKLSILDTKGKLNDLMLLFIAALAFATLCSFVFTYMAMKKNEHLLSSLMGLLPVPLMLGILFSQMFTSLSYLFTVTLWALLVTIVVTVFLKDRPDVLKWAYLSVTIVFGIILFMLYTPIVYTAYSILPTQFIIINAAICCVPITIFAGMVIAVYKSFMEGNIE